MSGYLARVWQLVVLKVQLDLSRRVPVIASHLVAHPDGEEVVLWSREDPLEAFGLPSGAAPPSRLRVPAELSAAVSAVVREHLADHDGTPVLWLRLVPPYGYLGAVPWEDLVRTIGMPVLRIPDRLPVPVDFGNMWSAALVLSAPHRATWGADHVLARVEALRRHLPAPWRLDVFADAHTHRVLTDAPGAFPSPWGAPEVDDVGTHRLVLGDADVPHGDVRLHDPARAVPAHRQRGALRRTQAEAGHRPTRPLDEANQVWSDWIITALAGRAVRALHVVALGAFDGDHPVVLFDADPGDLVHEPGATATDDELALLADVLGASLISFAAPPSRRADLALRMLADRIGQSRPGPTVFASLRHDPGCDALAAAEAFVALPGGTAGVPQHPALFGYIQPESVHPALREGWSGAASRTVYGVDHLPGADPDVPTKMRAWAGAVMPADTEIASVVGSEGDLPGVPVWVASSARFIDTHRAALMNDAAAPGEPPTTKRAYDEGVASALEDIEDLIMRRGGAWR